MAVKRKHIPLRTCIACRQKRPKRELVRIVHTPDGETVVDPKGKQPGRGTYLCPSRRCWDIALGRGSLGRALKCEIRAEEMASLRAYAGLLPSDGEAVEGLEQVLSEGGR